MAGLVLATTVAVPLGGEISFITGGLGILLSVLIFFGVKDIKRGSSEPEFENIENVEHYKFEWHKVKDVLKKIFLIYVFTRIFRCISMEYDYCLYFYISF